MTAYGKVAVLMGGWSAEREISLLSGSAVLAGLQEAGVDAHAVDVDHDVIGELQRGGYQRVFNVLHGRGGEDGVIQGALETIAMPYTGSGVTASALAMDKILTKQIWQAHGIRTPRYWTAGDEQAYQAVREAVTFPAIVKPAHEGSSIGMARVDDITALDAAWQAARGYDQSVLIEQWIDGAEYTAAVLGREVLPLIRLETHNVFYDYAAKYESEDTRYLCPCGLPPAQEDALRELSLQAFDAVGASGWGRVDFMLDATGQPWFIEVNTVPGMTSHSLVPMAAQQHGIAFDALTVEILATSLDGSG